MTAKLKPDSYIICCRHSRKVELDPVDPDRVVHVNNYGLCDSARFAVHEITEVELTAALERMRTHAAATT